MKRKIPIEETKKERFVVADKDKYGKVKETLAHIVKEGLEDQDLNFVRPFLEQLLKEAGAYK